MEEATPIIEMRNIKKHFGAVQALRGVDLALRHNEVLGLVGDNAAGKSTLMKVLSGAYIRRFSSTATRRISPNLKTHADWASRWCIRTSP
jgi:ABC-type sugar transport system ATPase subunit